MVGSIRAGVGFLLTFGAVGGLDAGSDLASCLALSAIGLALLCSGVSAMKESK
jgi:hypothetical protein